MFDIGFPELMLVAVVMLLVLGPERLPEALRTAGLWFGRLQRNFQNVKTEIEREIGMDEIRRQLHNESVMAEMRKLEQDLKASSDPRFPGTGDMSSTRPGDALGPNDDLPDLADSPEEADAAARNALTPHHEEQDDAHSDQHSDPQPDPQADEQLADHAYDDTAHQDPEHELTAAETSKLTKPTRTAGDEQHT